MMSRRNSRKQVVRTFLRRLKTSTWLGTARKWWPDYVFHFTDLRNAVSILKEGALLSRTQAELQNLMATDNASRDIIASTNEEWKDYVRLYFRPRTPTQYRNEGIRPKDELYDYAHCPVPIYFLFDSSSILSRTDCMFSEGNLASTPKVFSSAADLDQIPFEYVYHDSPLSDTEKGVVTFHRNAEVIIPKYLNLNALKFIVCRSQAEYETLLHLLPTNAVKRWSGRIILDSRSHVFFKRWVYLESVELRDSKAVFKFHQQPQYAGDFLARVTFYDTLTDITYYWEEDELTANGQLEIPLGDIAPLSDYTVRLTLDDNIAYANRYEEYTLPW